MKFSKTNLHDFFYKGMNLWNYPFELKSKNGVSLFKGNAKELSQTKLFLNNLETDILEFDFKNNCLVLDIDVY